MESAKPEHYERQGNCPYGRHAARRGKGGHRAINNEVHEAHGNADDQRLVTRIFTACALHNWI